MWALCLLAAGCSVYDEGLLSPGATGGGAGATGGGGAGVTTGGGNGGTGATGGGGAAPECMSATDCPGMDTECHTRTCTGGNCGANDAPAGTALAQQTAGDCKEQQCDGSGGIITVNDDTDLPDDAKECTIDECTQGMPSNTSMPVGAGCTQGGGAHCNALGDCVECTTGADCASQVCNAQFQCAAPTCMDMVHNGGETDVDCGGGMCPPCDVGQMCLVATDCTTAKCGPPAGVCQYRLVISEVRSRGPAGATDELVEIYNPTDAPVVLDAQWKIESRGSTASNYATKWTGSGATIAPHGHYLVTGAGYTQMPAGDASLSSGIADASSVRLIHMGEVIDALCFYYNASTLNDYMVGMGFSCEGTPIMSPTGTSNVDMSMERLPGGVLGNGTDTDDNPSDFQPLNPSNPQSTASAPTP